jgi:hypothetical protein
MKRKELPLGSIQCTLRLQAISDAAEVAEPSYRPCSKTSDKVDRIKQEST